MFCAPHAKKLVSYFVERYMYIYIHVKKNHIVQVEYKSGFPVLSYFLSATLYLV